MEESKFLKEQRDQQTKRNLKTMLKLETELKQLRRENQTLSYERDALRCDLQREEEKKRPLRGRMEVLEDLVLELANNQLHAMHHSEDLSWGYQDTDELAKLLNELISPEEEEY